MAESLFYQLAAAGVQGLTPYQPGKPIEELEREYGVRGAVKLASNENPLGPSPMAIDAIYGVLGESGRYPDGNGFALKTALSQCLGIPANQITLGNGSSDLLEFAARVLISPEHEVIYSQYCFALYPLLIQILGAKGHAVPAKGFGHDLEAMVKAVNSQTRLVYIANPNNPTGTWLHSDELEAFLAALPEHVLVVLDEAYYEYVNEAQYPYSLAWMSRYPNLMITRTFSKIYGLAGLRIGYGVSHPDLADLMNRVRPPFNVNSLALAAATAALQDHDHLQRSRKVNQAGMAQLTMAFTALGLDYIPSVANFVTVDVKQSGDKVYENLLRHGVIVRPMTGYGLPRHVRVTVGREEENARFIQVLETVLEEFR
ncbi:aminotransferase [Nitrosococcus oceani ATCC 19707]|uniref:Histidinol-phosphate aminotransferase 1 n=2 Tax=Nitrosococcus oceani TaxID=1229 RepID=HIS81_NITOC|nr:histidinol-phosphate transaminase [Nitrosococcus oceani]Q3JEN8.1 RecName: Full=Histidinol-phosphate aminotransferase 1; AltName: Full=Imidazole acetol-phosphate transaminase 1 [Nitrosococcus oceani ATCC 19707]KFI20843.1 aspartate aminotransferase [Nitrosococcus oceani C-27]ABA56708.1 aminotransferase [Nitrosococcus oceani ATCC 19707]EDZ66071.1 histidinol-phosphate aminotransferase [Nitrosococcus oceani AFC27]GEM21630.1 histidinol-phosphate aminotransferase 1 [Nitrosococcus oceani]